MNKITTALKALMNRMRGRDVSEEDRERAIEKTVERYRPGVPFVVTPENREWWAGRSGQPSRGRIIDAKGGHAFERRGGGTSFDFLAGQIGEAQRGGETARDYIAMPHVARTIRNRPRLKAMLGGAS